MFRPAMLAALLLLTPLTLLADDWPQWLGPQRDSVWREEGIVDKFPEKGPEVLWRTEAGLGYSGPAVVGEHVYIFDYLHRTGELAASPSARNRLLGEERVRCLNAKTGEQIWEHKYECSYFVSYPSGPRCTPTVADGKVYTLGAEGHLSCLNAKTGTLAWRHDLKKKYNMPEAPIWGFAGHPLVEGDKLFCLVGGEGSVAVCFNKDSGAELWKNLTASEPGYAPPTMIEHNGTQQLLIWHADALNSLDPESGEVYWSQELKPNYGMSIITPRKSGDLLFACGIGEVGALFQLTTTADGKPGAERVWDGTGRTAIYCANSTPFIEDGVIFGCDIRPGMFMAVDLKTAERLWETTELITGARPAAHATAFIVKQGANFILFTEQGDLVITKLSRNGFREVSRAHIIEPTGDAFGRPVVWTHPAFANKCCYARNDKEIICVDLAK